MEAKIGRYEIIKRIGRGSQGSVYLGRDPTLDRLVAVKVLTATDAELNMVDDDGTPLEARISSKLKHPNIVPIYDAGECAAGPYLIFEYVEGLPFAQVLKSRGALSIEDAVPMIASILKALSTAHAAEILHPMVANEWSIKNSEYVRLASPSGAISNKIRVRVTERIGPDSVFMAHGFGHKSKRLRLTTGVGADDSELMSNIKIDPIMGSTGMRANVVTFVKEQA